jgi:CRP-like cAMP-binding protein
VLERVRGEATRDPLVVQSAARVLDTLVTAEHATVPVDRDSALEVVRHLSTLPVLKFVPIEELFRLADQLEHVRYRAGQRLFEEGDRADRFEFVLDGEIVVQERGVEASRVGAGDLIGLEEVLASRPMRRAAGTQSSAVCLSGRNERVLALLADHAAVTEGLFRSYLGLDSSTIQPIVRGAMPTPETLFPASTNGGQPLSLAQKALLLEQTAIFSHAAAEALLALSNVVVEVPLREGDTLFSRSDAPSIYILLSGELSVDVSEQPDPAIAGRGDELGVVPTLTGRPMGTRARVIREGAALRIQRGDLFDFLGDHVDLLQAVFSVVLPDDRERARIQWAERSSPTSFHPSAVRRKWVRSGSAHAACGGSTELTSTRMKSPGRVGNPDRVTTL